ncbi:MAG TPA: enoyl-CoA hydratase-related protein [Euzebyales bacterium]
MSLVTLEHADGLATVTLRRPEARNAVNLEMKIAFIDALHRAAHDDDVRALLLRAEGPAFCVGQDLREHADALERGPQTALTTVRAHYNRIVTGIDALDVPVVVAISGACVGAGLGFALAGDIRVAADDARFATAFTGIGLASDSGLARALVRTAGAGVAAELLLLGEPFSAEQARAWGLVTRVVAADDVDETAATLARRLAEGPTRAFARVKALLRRADTTELATMLSWEADAQEALALTADHRTAVSAFLDKQRPQFTGR